MVRFSLYFLAVAWLFLSAVSQAEVGVDAKSVRFRIVTSLSGPVAKTGALIVSGYAVGFGRANEARGVFGRKLEIQANNDFYDPVETVKTTSRILSENRSFALIGSNGTSTAKAVLPLVAENGIPFLFPRTGDPSIRAFHKNVFHFRPPFSVEIAALMAHVAKHGLGRVAILYQSDGFGDALRSAVISAVPKLAAKIEVVSVAGIARDATADKYIADAFERIALGTPDVVVLATSLPLSAPFIKKSLEAKKKWKFLAVSSTNNLSDLLKGVAAEVIFSQVVPNPFAATHPEIVENYLSDMRKAHLEAAIGFTSLEAYISARIVTEALQRAGRDLTREKFIHALEEKPFALGGMEVGWTAQDHGGNAPVQLTRYKDDLFYSFSGEDEK